MIRGRLRLMVSRCCLCGRRPGAVLVSASRSWAVCRGCHNSYIAEVRRKMGGAGSGRRPSPVRRTSRVMIYLSADEKSAVESFADEAGLDLSEYIRKVLTSVRLVSESSLIAVEKSLTAIEGSG